VCQLKTVSTEGFTPRELTAFVLFVPYVLFCGYTTLSAELKIYTEWDINYA